ncbi:glycoside hydrolase superfamily [Daldinia decipiens]|uniref:glycoside hydrolase superfamily n=1 Tax=Daldinia decipiens TaxID=326647 RepID=UPI0020C41B06|nr:glycoside hydrolase superfamily [Daldinia decipiens]KAI1653820.1 glycoside hydrolase superfamily [Daldinia decipiens]
MIQVRSNKETSIASITSTTTSAASTSTQDGGSSSDSIGELFKAKGKLYSKSQNAAIIRKDFGQLTPENSMKTAKAFAATRSSGTNSYRTTPRPSQIKRSLPAALRATLAPLSEDTRAQIALGDGVFTQVLGKDFVRIAFEAAHKAGPDAKLYIDDFHLGSGTSAKTTTGMFEYVGLEKFATTGVKELTITELDIVNAPVDEYVKVANACLAVEKCVGITIWGVSDADSWQAKSSPLF